MSTKKIIITMMVAIFILPPLILDLKRASQKAFWFARSQIKHEASIDYEQNLLTTKYHDFFGWRRKEFNGKLVTINPDGYRVHSNSEINNAQILIFGGSTIWGTGVVDQSTVPAQLERITNTTTFNMGETAFTAQQNLNLLIKAITNGAKPKAVIFYDGVNDIGHKCRSESDAFGTFQENTFRQIIDEKTTLNGIYTFKILQPGIESILKAISTLQYSYQNLMLKNSDASQSRFYNCTTDKNKIKKIVKNFVAVWAAAKEVCDAYGIKFIPILQPLAYVGNPNLDDLPEVMEDKILKSQYSEVYPEIKISLREHNFIYFDMTRALDGAKSVYTDFCHLNAEGNRIISENIKAILVKTKVM